MPVSAAGALEARLERKDQRKRQKPTRAPVENGYGSYARSGKRRRRSRRSGKLDEAAGAFVQILLIPVQVVQVFVGIVQAAVDGGIFGGGGA